MATAGLLNKLFYLILPPTFGTPSGKPTIHNQLLTNTNNDIN